MRYFTNEKFKYLSKEDRDLIAQEFDFLDTIDLKPLIYEAIEEGYDLYTVMEMIEDKYSDEYEKEDFIFNNIDISEFRTYLKEKYHMNVREVTEYYIEP
jgi:hypothetical protein